jgi:predicted outer membrane repeat protein
LEVRVRPITLLLVVAACDSETAIDTNVDDTDAGTFVTPIPADADNDGYLNVGTGGADCDDNDYFVNPEATEHCDGIDENCNGDIDEGAIDGTLFYADADGDGFGDPATGIKSCEAQPGLVSNTNDCDDADPTRNPGADEICNDGFDDDCAPTTFETAMIGDAGYWNLDDAIAASLDGGTITLCPGLVFAKNVTVDKAVTITSWDGTRTGSILDGGVAGVGAMFIVDGGALTLQSLTIQNANDGVATALTAGGGSITADDCSFEDNVANGNGGALAGTTITVSGSDFINNSAGSGGAIYATAPGLLTITDSLFTLNESDSDGGAIYTSAAAVLSGVDLTDNDSDGNGGGLAANGVAATITLIDTTFTSNNADDNGGGLYSSGANVTADATTVFDSNTNQMNAPDNQTAGGGGAYLLANGKDVTWDGGLFINNKSNDTSFSAGGGIYFAINTAGGTIDAGNITADGNAAYTGAGIYFYGGPTTLHDSLTQNNVALLNGSGYGGGTSINLTNGKAVTLERVEYRGNSGVQAAATDVYEANAVFIDCTIEENAADSKYGAIYVDALSTMSVQNSDMGVAPLDNSPADVYIGSSGRTYNYGDDATFDCDYNSGLCF